MHEPVSSIVTQAGAQHIHSVMIAGHWRKRAGRLLFDGLPRVMNELAASGRRILQAQGIASMA